MRFPASPVFSSPHQHPPQKQQAGSGTDRQAGVAGTQQALTVMVQGQGQTTGQLQIIPQGVTVIPGPGQQLMQAALPNGQMQRFLFTPLASAATPASSTGRVRSRDELLVLFAQRTDIERINILCRTAATTVPGQPNSASIKSPALPAQQAAAPVQAGTTPLATTGAPSSATPQGQLPPQTQAHMPTQSPTSLQVKTQGGAAQLQLQQSPQLISMSGLPQPVQVGRAKISHRLLCRLVSTWFVKCDVSRPQVLAQLQAQQSGGSLPQHIKLQLPIQIQQTGTTSAQGGQVGRQSACLAKEFTV